MQNQHIFDPIQPFFVFHADSYYKKVAPGSPIAHFYRFTSSDRMQIRHDVVPDGSIDVIFACSKDNPQAFIAGSVEMARENIFEEGTDYFGIRFVPGAFDHFGNISSKELIGENADFVDVTGRTDILEKICFSGSFSEQIQTFTDFFGQTQCTGQTPLVTDILGQILRRSGNIQVQELERLLHYSRRHLTRTFRDFTGMDIRRFSNIIRFQRAITLINHGLYPSITDVSAETGYYDQPHFQKDFHRFAMMSPGAYQRLITGSDYLNRIILIP